MFFTTSPTNRYSQKLDSKLKVKLTGHFEAKFLIEFLYSFLLPSGGRQAVFDKHLLRPLVLVWSQTDVLICTDVKSEVLGCFCACFKFWLFELVRFMGMLCGCYCLGLFFSVLALKV